MEVDGSRGRGERKKRKGMVMEERRKREKRCWGEPVRVVVVVSGGLHLGFGGLEEEVDSGGVLGVPRILKGCTAKGKMVH